MKNLFWLLGLTLLTPAGALAQVQVNSAALQQLQGLPPAPPAAQTVTAPPPARHSVPHHKRHVREKVRPKPALKAEPPAKPKVAAPAHPVPHPATAPAPKPKPAALPTVARINFAPGSAILPADAAAALKPFCASSARIPLMAHAPATPDNQGEAMQLSMQRAFAIRAALISCGVPAQNIIPQSTVDAFGPNSDEALIGVSTKP